MAKRYYSPTDSDPTTGKILEEEYFGKIDLKGDKRSAAMEFYKQLSGGQSPTKAGFYLPFNAALKFAKAFQPWKDAASPSKKVARDLLDFICDELGLDPDDEDAEHLKFFTSVGSPLDEKHGVDAFIEYRGHRILIDVTKNPAKRFDDSSGDRMIMEQLPDWTEAKNKTAYIEALQKYARYSAEVLQSRPEHTREMATALRAIR